MTYSWAVAGWVVAAVLAVVVVAIGIALWWILKDISDIFRRR